MSDDSQLETIEATRLNEAVRRVNEAVRRGCTAANVHLACNFPNCACVQIPARFTRMPKLRRQGPT